MSYSQNSVSTTNSSSNTSQSRDEESMTIIRLVSNDEKENEIELENHPNVINVRSVTRSQTAGVLNVRGGSKIRTPEETIGVIRSESDDSLHNRSTYGMGVSSSVIRRVARVDSPNPRGPKVDKKRQKRRKKTSLIDKWKQSIESVKEWDEIPIIPTVPSLKLFRIFYGAMGISRPRGWNMYLSYALSKLISIFLIAAMGGTIFFTYLGAMDPLICTMFMLAYTFCAVSHHVMKKYVRTGLLKKLLFMSAEGAFGIMHASKLEKDEQQFAASEELGRFYIIMAIISSFGMFIGWTGFEMLELFVFEKTSENSNQFYMLYLYFRWFFEAIAIFIFMGCAVIFNYTLGLHGLTVKHYTALLKKIALLKRAQINQSESFDDSKSLNTLSTVGTNPNSVIPPDNGNPNLPLPISSSLSNLQEDSNAAQAARARSESSVSGASGPYANSSDVMHPSPNSNSNVNPALTTSNNPNVSISSPQRSASGVSTGASPESNVFGSVITSSSSIDELELMRRVGQGDVGNMNTLIHEFEVLSEDLSLLSAYFSIYWLFGYASMAAGLLIGVYIFANIGIMSMPFLMDKVMAVAFTGAAAFALWNLLNAPINISRSYDRLIDVANSNLAWEYTLTIRFLQYLTVKPRAFRVIGMDVQAGMIARSIYTLGAASLFIIRLTS